MVAIIKLTWDGAFKYPCSLIFNIKLSTYTVFIKLESQFCVRKIDLESSFKRCYHQQDNFYTYYV